jgi:hypothetical protein
MDLLPLDRARQTVRTSLCANCYGQLIALEDKPTRLYRIACATDGCPCDGLVSRKWVERQEAKSRADLVEAKVALRDAMPWTPKKSQEQILKELGF